MKKSIALFLMLVTIVSAMAGCGKNDGKTDLNNNTDSSVTDNNGTADNNTNTGTGGGDILDDGMAAGDSGVPGDDMSNSDTGVLTDKDGDGVIGDEGAGTDKGTGTGTGTTGAAK
jgi:hypothetical protein